jgi:hypothetical protein
MKSMTSLPRLHYAAKHCQLCVLRQAAKLDEWSSHTVHLPTGNRRCASGPHSAAGYPETGAPFPDFLVHGEGRGLWLSRRALPAEHDGWSLAGFQCAKAQRKNAILAGRGIGAQHRVPRDGQGARLSQVFMQMLSPSRLQLRADPVRPSGYQLANLDAGLGNGLPISPSGWNIGQRPDENYYLPWHSYR